MMWHLEGGSCIAIIQNVGTIRSVALTSDFRRAITASDDGILKVWDLPSGTCVVELKAHVGTINGVA
eukprot:scaffold342357_cov18-Prasinocladus_malaysianus.AAC.1